MMSSRAGAPEIQHIVDAIAARQRFVLCSHARPDGDSIGSQLAMAYALRALGKQVSVINRDAAPAPLMVFPGVPEIEIAGRVDGAFDAAIVMECSDLARTGVLAFGCVCSSPMWEAITAVRDACRAMGAELPRQAGQVWKMGSGRPSTI